MKAIFKTKDGLVCVQDIPQDSSMTIKRPIIPLNPSFFDKCKETCHEYEPLEIRTYKCSGHDYDGHRIYHEV